VGKVHPRADHVRQPCRHHRQGRSWARPLVQGARQRTPPNRLPTPEDIVSVVFFMLDTRHENSANLLDAAGMHHI
jgi:hypothetical protein